MWVGATRLGFKEILSTDRKPLILVITPVSLYIILSTRVVVIWFFYFFKFFNRLVGVKEENDHRMLRYISHET